MKLTKQLEAEIKALMDDYWNSYFRGDIKHWANYLLNDYRNIGGTEEEIWNSKKEILDYTYRVIDQMAGQAEIRNKKTQIIAYAPYIMVHEFMDLFIKVEGEWAFYGKFRLSSLIQKTAGEWKVLHQHGSYPDSHTEKGEAFAFDKLRKENTQLRDAVKRRTVELEHKSRELEIEAALERVRTVAMGMHKPADLLNICEILFKELQALGFNELRNALIHTFNDEQKYFLDYDYSDFTGGCISHIPYSGHPAIDKFIKEIKSADDAFTEIVISGKELEDWKAFRKTNNEADDSRLDNIAALYYYFYSIGPGDIGISTFTSISEDKREVLKRFRNVFDFAYKRYTDVAQAEAQSREAQIELGLERVRARAMAMQSSDELKELVKTLFVELTRLDVNLHRCMIWIVDPATFDARVWIVNPETMEAEDLVIPYNEDPFYQELLTGWKERNSNWIYTLEGAQYKNWITFLFNETGFSRLPEIVKDGMRNLGKAIFWASNYNYGAIQVASSEPYSEENIEILNRFSKVFNMTYTRFRDLQKAEAQAKEGQIEVALERVRSKTMAMHHTSEIHSVITEVTTQLLNLEFKIDTANFNVNIDVKKTPDMDVWISNPQQKQYPSKVHIPYFDHPMFNRSIDLINKGEKFLADTFTLEEKNSFYNYLFEHTDFKNASEEGKNYILNAKGLARSVVILKNTALSILNYDGSLYTEEENAILKRMGSVFDQAYTRFQDLQKAEAQVREAKIEAGLERVRYKAMAMQSSEDVGSATAVVFNEISLLGVETMRCGIAIIHPDKTGDVWVAATTSEGKEMKGMGSINFNNHPLWLGVSDAWKNKEENFSYALKGDDLKSYYKALANSPNYNSSYIQDQEFPDHFFYASFFEQGAVFTFSLQPHKEEKQRIIKKFTAVFSLTFRRYLDLQKAEANARESKIEASLERVRSKAMAMHSSEDLAEAIKVFYHQLEQLNLTPRRCGVGLMDKETHNVELSTMNTTEQGDSIEIIGNLKLTGHPVLESIYDNWILQKEYHPVLQGNEIKEYYQLVRPQIAYPDYPTDTAQYGYFFFFKEGGVYAWTEKELVEDELKIYRRFTTVLSLTYRRYKDLKEAEAQTKEAKIEAALERVRSRTMGMQKSEELKEVIQVVYEQFVHLNILIEHTGFIMDYKARDDMNIWLADQHEVPSQVIIPYFDSAHWNSFNEAKEKGIDFFANHLSFEEKNRFYQDLFKLIPGVPDETKEYYFSCPGLAISTVLLENVGLYIENFSGIPYTDEENNTLMRFGKVFQQTYTRFLDLQKAEAQARKAKIEASLERVRAKAMAMHRSEELDEVLEVLFDQFDVLGIVPMSTHMTLINLETNTFTFRETGKGGRKSFGEQTVAIDSMDIWKEAADRWRTTEPLSLNKLHFPKESLPIVWQVFHESFASMPEGHKIVPEDYPDGIYHTAGNCKFGYLGMNQVRKATEEEEQIVLKFAIEFGRLYQRFLDLQKAEAQAREAQIVAALERVRSSSLAMHNSNELKDVVKVVFDNLRSLGLQKMDSVNINILHKGSKDFDLWLAAPGQDYTKNFHLPYFDHPIANEFFQAVESKKTFQKKSYTYEEKNEYFKYMFENSDNKYLPEERKHLILNGAGYSVSAAIAAHSSIFVHNYNGEAFSDADDEIIIRFSKVFDEAYNRFLDLQKAEAQAKESQIQLGLERVRAKTIAMQKSEELLDVINVVSEQLLQLDFKFDNVSLGINNHNYDIDFWMAAKGLSRPLQIHSPYINNPLVNRIIEARKQGLDFFSDTCTPEENKAWIHHTINNVGPNVFSEPIKQFLLSSPGYSRSTALMEDINFFIGNYAAVPYTEEENNIFRRFANVIGQSYTRFLDLQKAEAQAKEAKIEAALERVRSRTLAMHKSEELSEAATVIFKQLIGLGIAPNRLFIGIVKDEGGEIEYWITDEHGSKVTKQFTGNAARNQTVQTIFNGWKEKRGSLTIDMQGEELQRYFHYLNDELNVPFKDVFSQKRRVLNIAYFGNGFIGIASQDAQPAETVQLLERFAAVFNLTFIRFNDLKLAEANAIQAQEDLIKLQTEKRRAEDALKGLRAAQAQLVQSEKMASLGELTAGIAHEIQNPLNFVNNFSEINKELLLEMEEEMAKGNYEAASGLAKDVTGNQEKINFHGKRADAIVKGMLQHSRKSSEQKELTDINDLADEYLRLAYHGLRAKDKSFNAKFETNFDTGLKKMNVMSQDIGRVILNLINNAFYAVSEKQKQNIAGYEPTVTVSTGKKDNQVLISVHDNGNGIPQKVLDKIFQPFFTTKPTGQGTGLGLSLSYDIVTKAHGGELKVKTVEGEGSKFIIKLPMVS